jgi:hypothetical protein
MITATVVCGVGPAPRWFQATGSAPATDISDGDSGVGR